MTTGGPSNPGSTPEFPERRPAAPLERTSSEQIDAFFDRELDPQHSRELLAGLKNDPGRSEDIARTQRMLSLLRRTPLHGERAEENMIDAIMARVDRRRRFLPDAWRRFVTAGRLAAAATVLLAGFGVAVLGRVHPDMLRLAPQQAPIASLVDSSRTEAASGAAQCCLMLETISDQAAAPFRRIHTQVVSAQSGSRLNLGTPSDPLRPGVLASVRFIDRDSEVPIARGSGEPVEGAMGASFSLGIELVSARQRSGASAPVFMPTLRADAIARSIEVRSASSATGTASAVLTTVPGPVACQSVTVGDHTVVVPATVDGQGWIGGPNAARRLLLIQASPSDLFPSR